MLICFHLIDASRFHDRIVPALAETHHKKNFRFSRELAIELAPAARAFWQRYYCDASSSLIGQVADGRPFSRDAWNLFVGELLWQTADESPEIQTALETLLPILNEPAEPTLEINESRSPLVQAHRGSCDLTFGVVCYQPDRTAYNDCADVKRLAAYLEAIDLLSLSADNLQKDLPVDAAADWAEELDFARESLSALSAMYQRARQRAQIVVCDLLEP